MQTTTTTQTKDAKMTTEQFWVLEWADSYGISLSKARRLSDAEKLEFSEWFREIGLVAIADTQIKLPLISWRDTPARQADGRFLGCENACWTLSEAEAESFRQLNEQRAVEASRLLSVDSDPAGTAAREWANEMAHEVIGG